MWRSKLPSIMTPQRRFLSTAKSSLQLMSSPTAPLEYIPEFVLGLKHVIDIDPTLREIIEKSSFPSYAKGQDDPKQSSFESLARGIISQQVSGSAANSIRKKFMRMFQDPETPDDLLVFPTPDQVLLKSAEEMRSAGLSARKGEYIHGLATAFANGELSDELLTTWDDDEVVDRLVALKGIGRKSGNKT